LIGKAGKNAPPLDGGLSFIAAAPPAFQAALGVGLLAQGQGEGGAVLDDLEKNRLTAAFRNAYIDGLLRGIPLAGVLGGDLVHLWPPAAPLTRVQNWRTGEPRPNSWGIPSLVLAAEGLTVPGVFIIRGPVLDAYGKSAGLRGANGAAGYGSPRGDDFFYQGGLAQRFDHGLIAAGSGGRSRFFPEENPAPEIPPGTGAFSDPAIEQAFRSAWTAGTARNLPPLEPDAPVRHIDFSAQPWVLSPGVAWGEEEFSLVIRGIYYQTFGRGEALLILVDPVPPSPPEGQPASSPLAWSFPPYPRIITSPFLEALLAAPDQRLPGAQGLTPDSLPSGYERGGDEAARLLMGGISLYGVPLSNALALENLPEDGEKAASGAGGWREAQRFSRGWLVRGNSEQ
jgi:hypothetical protein